MYLLVVRSQFLHVFITMRVKCASTLVLVIPTMNWSVLTCICWLFILSFCMCSCVSVGCSFSVSACVHYNESKCASTLVIVIPHQELECPDVYLLVIRSVTNTRHCDSELLSCLYFCTTLLSAGPESSGLYSLSINTCTILFDLI